MGLSSKEFKRIFDDGFEQRYKDSNNGESELRCFDCGKKAELKKVNRKWRVRCSNNHKWKMTDFLVQHIYMRDGVVDGALISVCDFTGN